MRVLTWASLSIVRVFDIPFLSICERKVFFYACSIGRAIFSERVVGQLLLA